MNLLECKICEYKSKQLFQHLKHKHNITKEEYRNKYGQDCIMQVGFNVPKDKKESKMSNAIKKSYENGKKQLENIRIYSKEEMKNILLNNDYYKKFIGKTKQRTLLKENPMLYKSIYFYSDKIEKYFNKKINLTLPTRIKFIIEFDYDISKLRCECGNFTINNMCKKCINTYRYPSKEYFKRMYKEKWLIEREKDSKNRKKILKGVLNLDWFNKKYGNNGYKKYKEHYSKIFKNKNLPYSKISQDLFWKLQNELNLKNCYFAENNNEYRIFLNRSERNELKQNVIYIDFLFNNKIIEFDGNYWHKNSKEKDSIRDKILKNRGYDILRIKEKDYLFNKLIIINECKEFINE